ncbi:RusA family crossover junction endodeoxyribonuclease [Bacteroides ovatus]|jgi:Holliday junction resolvase RusA-like endonuclease|uniref:RusA family crossover junction endodeoxyribonuclease n=3 Tax=root TaxID=1 RepID=A0AAP7BKG4_BACOV|nr:MULTISPECIES: RusA family crossover junction endodeoxyribonuclease [Bacteroides]DAF59228.1 MAG TPA: Endodeoxyribonuclease RusA [Siphoviridae sp. ct3fB6]DAM25918.1 MAG TPA: Endodeoxyribonuclease RusA [Caudoviricetes sp.]KDS22718.1 endodeoxyribonuclease RusA family protein [Bacteroides ovatus str. 3725 D1 iv]MCE8794614.1 RusA family crossover junction endodeoxyribonuclease [Bacteroides ovatus]MCE8876073.1 RusA family crossover junction endodeoxyribonuclease [Bacteroides ovatus]
MMQIIIGKCPSKSNCYKIIQQRGKDGKYHGSLAKKDALVMYEKSFYLQCSQYRNKQIKGLFELYLSVHYDTQRPDLDNCLKIVLDCLQSCRAIRNDRNCVKIVAEKYIDKTNPRIEFEIKEV